jgi:predicted methyltransferase
MGQRIYKYKLDFYYKSLIIYLLTLLIYIIIKGDFFQERFEVVIQDPIIYVIALFITFFIIVLISNAIRAREIIIDEEKITLRNRFGQREILKNEILQVKFSRTKKIRQKGKSDVRIIKLRLKNRKRYLRIRLSDFQNEKELVNEFRSITKTRPETGQGK